MTDDGLVSIDETRLYVSPESDARLMFEESLDVLDGDEQRVGVVTVSVEAGETDTFTVYQQSSVMMRVQSEVLRTLDTSWEVRLVKRPNTSRMLRITGSHDKYRVFRSVQGRSAVRVKSDIEKSTGVRIILEGANTVLLRTLALSRVFGRLQCLAVDHEGAVCRCQYGVERGSGSEVRVRRTLGGHEVLTTILSESGRILLHTWSSSGYSLRSRESGVALVPQLAREESTLAELELKADVDAYFKKKTELIQLMTQYVQDQTDVNDMIADFLKEILMDKPEDVVAYADEYFSEFVGLKGETVVKKEPSTPLGTSVDPEQVDHDVRLSNL